MDQRSRRARGLGADVLSACCGPHSGIQGGRGPGQGPKTALRAEPWLGNIHPIIQHVERGSKVFKTQSPSQKGLMGNKPAVLCSDKREWGKGQRLQT